MHYVVEMHVLDGVAYAVEDAPDCLLICEFVFLHVVKKSSIFGILEDDESSLRFFVEDVVVHLDDVGVFELHMHFNLIEG